MRIPATFRAGTGSYRLDYSGWDQDQVVLVRLILTPPPGQSTQLVDDALRGWLESLTTALPDQFSPPGRPVAARQEWLDGGCRLTLSQSPTAVYLSVCSGGEDGLDSTEFSCADAVAAVRAAVPSCGVSWREWRAAEFADLESLYFAAAGE
ncbi:MAG: hypothetical protein Q3999_07385 [Buchananella hordeovulneris]|nr:hypothetical protein [Buchananella hordeovulneris]